MVVPSLENFLSTDPIPGTRPVEADRCGVRSEGEAGQASERGATMADKSPRQHLSKKAGKSIKEKRAEKHAKASEAAHPEIIPTTKQRRGH
jgi:hypothetical protein